MPVPSPKREGGTGILSVSIEEVVSIEERLPQSASGVLPPMLLTLNMSGRTRKAPAEG